MAKDWQKADLSYLKRYAATKSLDELAQRFETDTETIQAKLDEIGVRATNSRSGILMGNEPLLETYEEALDALHKGNQERSMELFRKVAEECDQPELAGRARQYLASHERAAQPEAEVDPFLEAVVLKNQGDLDRALEMSRSGSRHAKDERFAYLAASIYSIRGEFGEAISLLEKAIDMNPTNRVHAYHDPDFEGLRGQDGSAKLFAVG